MLPGSKILFAFIAKKYVSFSSGEKNSIDIINNVGKLFFMDFLS